MPECILCVGSKVNRLYPRNAPDIWYCRGCNLQFRDPQPTDERLAEIYHDHYYGTDSNSHDEVYREPTPPSVVEQVLDGLEQLIDGWKSKRVLDCGCGIGAFGHALQRRGADVVGVEPPPMFDLISQHVQFEVFPSVERAAQRRERFDVVTMCLVIEHLRRPLHDLAMLRQVLKPGGWLYAETANGRSFNAMLARHRWREIRKPEHLYWFNAANLGQCCRRAGFAHVQELNRQVTFTHHGLTRALLRRIAGAVGRQGGLRVLATNAAERF